MADSHIFSDALQLRVDISRKKGGTVQAKLVEETSGGRGDRFNYPFVLEPRGQIAYFDAREQVNIMAMIFRNPTVLMMGFMVCISVVFSGVFPSKESRLCP